MIIIMMNGENLPGDSQGLSIQIGLYIFSSLNFLLKNANKVGKADKVIQYLNSPLNSFLVTYCINTLYNHIRR